MAKPKKRSSLEVLTKKRLMQLIHHFEIDVPASGPKAKLVDAIAKSKSASFRAILERLNRAELADICRAHELDDSGKRKDAIAARILGEEPVDAAPAKPEKTRTSKNVGRKATTAAVGEQLGLELPSDRKLTVAELERYLWSVADILRGSIDS